MTTREDAIKALADALTGKICAAVSFSGGFPFRGDVLKDLSAALQPALRDFAEAIAPRQAETQSPTMFCGHCGRTLPYLGDCSCLTSHTPPPRSTDDPMARSIREQIREVETHGTDGHPYDR